VPVLGEIFQADARARKKKERALRKQMNSLRKKVQATVDIGGLVMRD